MPPFRVQTFRDGKLTSVQTVLAGSIDSAAEQICGKGLMREGKHGELVAIVQDEDRKVKVTFYRQDLGSAGIKRRE